MRPRLPFVKPLRSYGLTQARLPCGFLADRGVTRARFKTEFDPKRPTFAARFIDV